MQSTEWCTVLSPGMCYMPTDGWQQSSLPYSAGCSPLEKHRGHSPEQLSVTQMARVTVPWQSLPHLCLMPCPAKRDVQSAGVFLGRGRVKKGPGSCGNREIRVS